MSFWIHVSNLAAGLNENQDCCYDRALVRLGLTADRVLEKHIVKRSVDARKRSALQLNYTVALCLQDGTEVKEQSGVRRVVMEPLVFTPGHALLDNRPVIVGLGPAGLFCGLFLARLGYRPLVLERGASMEERIHLVERFQKEGVLSEQTNVQFGEGGAGTFSDGKLTTRIGSSLCDTVLQELCRAGAPAEITQMAKPHIGTDRLRHVVSAIRAEIEKLGGEVRFCCPMEQLQLKNGRVVGVQAGGEAIASQVVVLAAGHSARDTFQMLYRLGLPMETKPFSVGARIEHLQAQVDKALYGDWAGHPLLPQGEYQLSWRDEPNNRAAYTFCMCPGGVVVPSASSAGTVVTNGMSNHSRDGINANSALVVSVDSRDFGENPMDAIAFQHAIERKAYELTGGYAAPGQTVGNFLEDKPGMALDGVIPSYSIGVKDSSLSDVLPQFVVDYMKTGLRVMGRRQPGFDAPQAVLTGPETRTSSPVRLLRDGETLCSAGAQGLYPCGEGSGYAGGIMSAAVDGIRVAQKIIEQYKPFA